jgi:hypothetical protein
MAFSRILLVVIASLSLPLVNGCGHRAVESDEQREMRDWLENMVWHHGFSVDEVMAVTGKDRDGVQRLLEEHDIRVGERSSEPSTGGLLMLPYPGGRHPRIGFLDGAIDPHRDTKLSVFLPWSGGGYVVVDLPEAIWFRPGGERKLLYLAHTHIPTYWDERSVVLERFDWKREAVGDYTSRRRFPNGIEFWAHARVDGDVVRMELGLKNGSDEKITGLKTQICVMLKGAPEFNAQTQDNKVIEGEGMAVGSANGKRWIVTQWERARPWGNVNVPCMHADPTFPDLAPGAESALRGTLSFWEGDDVREALRESGSAKE